MRAALSPGGDAAPSAPFCPAAACYRPFHVDPDQPPTLTVVIDTEEEFDWSGPFDPANRSVANIAEQHRAQTVFRAHGVVPTYVVDHPVAADPDAVRVLRDFARRGECDIGAHLHPWVTPPGACRVPPRLAYPGNLPPAEERAKLAVLTETITASFGARPTIYKAGRYGLGAATAESLASLGYSVDVSLVPYTDFSDDGGPDFSAVAAAPVRLAPGLIGLPLSVGFAGRLAAHGATLYPCLAAARRWRLPGIAARLGLLERLRLSPEGHDDADMLRLVQAGLAAGVRLFMLTYHSSSLLPGCTPYVRDTGERDAFLGRIDRFLAAFLGPLGGRSDTVATVAARLAAAPQ